MNEQNELLFKDIISFGGLTNLNDENIRLRNQQIRDGFLIHTCNDYDNSLEVIKKASYDTDSLNIILKVYYNYPDRKHKRNSPLKKQIEFAIKRLGRIPKNFVLQFCCYFNSMIFKENFFLNFILGLKRTYNIKAIYFEYYPVYDYNLKSFLHLKNTFPEINFGIIGYQNLLNRVFNENNLKIIEDLRIPIAFIGVLGKNPKRDIIISKEDLDINRSNDLDEIDFNFFYLLKNIRRFKSSFGITQVSSFENYENLKKRLNKYDNLGYKLFNDFTDSYFLNKKINFIKNDQYGGKYFFKDYINNPKLILHFLKKRVLYSKGKSYYFNKT